MLIILELFFFSPRNVDDMLYGMAFYIKSYQKLQETQRNSVVTLIYREFVGNINSSKRIGQLIGQTIVQARPPRRHHSGR